MSIELIRLAQANGAKLIPSISGGKDSQAMLRVLRNNGFDFDRVVHCDLGRVEWPQTMSMCERSAAEYNVPMIPVYRSDKRELMDLWRDRMVQLMGTGKPFWSSSTNRYCTSNMKIHQVNRYFTSVGCDFIISCEGIRADESTGRAKKDPLTVRFNSSTHYNGMTAEEAIAEFVPSKKLYLSWYPIFNYSTEEVWNTYGQTRETLLAARAHYKATGEIVTWWPFHPAYAMGNDRLSCMFCIMGSVNDLTNAAQQNPALLLELIEMEKESGFTFKNNWSLTALQTTNDGAKY